MIIDRKIRDENRQYDINREVVKLSTLWSGKIDKYKHLKGKEIIPSDKRKAVEQANFLH